jgi:hypothetical protein
LKDKEMAGIKAEEADRSYRVLTQESKKAEQRYRAKLLITLDTADQDLTRIF